MISVENNDEFLGLEKTRYIHAKTVDYEEDSVWADETGWYDPEVLINELPEDYDLLVIDGPHGHTGRSGILNHLDFFRPDRLTIVDDVHRDAEAKLARELSERWGMKIEFHWIEEKSPDDVNRGFAILHPS